MNRQQITWWGYRHINGTLHLKRYLERRDIDDAKDSPFVAMTCAPFLAWTREEALKILQERGL